MGSYKVYFGVLHRKKGLICLSNANFARMRERVIKVDSESEKYQFKRGRG